MKRLPARLWTWCRQFYGRNLLLSTVKHFCLNDTWSIWSIYIFLSLYYSYASHVLWAWFFLYFLWMGFQNHPFCSTAFTRYLTIHSHITNTKETVNSRWQISALDCDWLQLFPPQMPSNNGSLLCISWKTKWSISQAETGLERRLLWWNIDGQLGKLRLDCGQDSPPTHEEKCKFSLDQRLAPLPFISALYWDIEMHEHSM